MKRIAVVTATRAEYGLLSPVIRELRARESDEFKAELIVTGTHLSDAYGRTIDEISERIDHTVEIPLDSGSVKDISSNQAQTLIKFTELFEQEKYNAVMLLGDRYETLAVAIAAGNTRTPVFHLCGGDVTEGALDEWIRHSITKISYLHFVTNDESRRRVIQLGESPERVFNFGSTSIDNIMNAADMSKAEALESVGLSDCSYALCTYHPVTMEKGGVEKNIAEFLAAVKAFPDMQFIVTKSNADEGGAKINELLDAADKEIANIHVHTSLGVRRYLSLMRFAECVVGNSSSGIIETPAFKVPTVNIGDRQKGRLGAESIINCAEDSKSIIDAMNMALSADFREVCKNVVSPYGDGHAAPKIAQTAYDTVMNKKIDLKKSFYDLRG